jgi:hypothetical protein
MRSRLNFSDDPAWPPHHSTGRLDIHMACLLTTVDSTRTTPWLYPLPRTIRAITEAGRLKFSHSV